MSTTRTTSEILKDRKQDINDFTAYGSALKGVIFLIDDKYVTDHELNQMENWIKNKRKQLKEIN